MKFNIKTKNYGLVKYTCINCNKALAIIPVEFLYKINPPCRECQGWEIKYDFEMYLLRINNIRYQKYMEMQKGLP